MSMPQMMTGSAVWSGMWEGYTGEGMDVLGKAVLGGGGGRGARKGRDGVCWARLLQEGCKKGRDSV